MIPIHEHVRTIYLIYLTCLWRKRRRRRKQLQDRTE